MCVCDELNNGFIQSDDSFTSEERELEKKFKQHLKSAKKIKEELDKNRKRRRDDDNSGGSKIKRRKLVD